jgi:TetR/AcrR family transcriptional repressor of nem operon
MAATRPRKQVNTAQRILDVAERLVQSRGFNGFSYANVAAELKITTASLHYHFPGKAELGQALIVRYGERFTDALEAIDSRIPDAGAKLDAYAGLYEDVLRGRRMCLCGILAAEYETLPMPMREAVIRFFDDNESWLARVLAQGQSEGTLSFDGAPRDAAQTVLSGLEGAMLIARPYGDLARFQSAAARLVASLAS